MVKIRSCIEILTNDIEIFTVDHYVLQLILNDKVYTIQTAHTHMQRAFMMFYIPSSKCSVLSVYRP